MTARLTPHTPDAHGTPRLAIEVRHPDAARFERVATVAVEPDGTLCDLDPVRGRVSSWDGDGCDCEEVALRVLPGLMAALAK